MRAVEPRQFRIEADRPLAMLRRCPVYSPTPLVELASLAAELGVAALTCKDETGRMGLGSFKALGGAFAVAQMITDASGETDLMSERAKAVAATMTFITASAGNHGLSVAAGARVFGAHAVIVLPQSAPLGFEARARAQQADVVRVEGSYEACVAYALAAAEKNDWLLLADGSWEGYVDRPALVMEGYAVLAEECREAFAAWGQWPTHVFLQAGVGGLAAAVAGHIREYWDEQPTIFVVEPDEAPSLMESVRAERLVHVDGAVSNMGRLDCKDASLIAFSALRREADVFVTVSDSDASAAAALLADHGIATTPSGAASLAALKATGLVGSSRCLMVATEGLEGG
jgi:diaminopropionate ammonia-lyase